MRVAGHAGRVEIALLMTARATHGRKPMAVRTALDRRLMQPALVALARAIAGRMTVDAARMSQDFAQLREYCRRARGGIARGKALRWREAVRSGTVCCVGSQHGHQHSRDRNHARSADGGFQLQGTRGCELPIIAIARYARMFSRHTRACPHTR
jgi:hypothetical protein